MNMRWLGQINSLPPSVGGGTFSKQNYTMLDNLFQSPHKGWDIRLLGDSGALYEFQSTHLQGVGHHRLRPDRQVLRFQSTHPQGVGHNRTYISLRVYTFQSTHPQGVGLYQLAVDMLREISIHPPARGGTIDILRISFRQIDFNPPTRKGWDSGGLTKPPGTGNFNPPTRKGWDLTVTCSTTSR